MYKDFDPDRIKEPQMARHIPHKCSRCLSDVVLIQPETKDGMPKDYMRGDCLQCMTRFFLDLKAGEILAKPMQERSEKTTSALEELAASNRTEIQAVNALLEKKGLLSKEEVLQELNRMRRNKENEIQ